MSPDEAYPARYEDRVGLKDGREVFLRPIRETDGDLLLGLFHKLSLKSVRLRFLTLLRTLPADLLFRFTHVNYDTEFALVALIREHGREAFVGVGRYAFDSDAEATDFAVAVRDDWQNNGLGRLLLRRILAIGKEHGISRFVTAMDPENRVMRKLIAEAGYGVKFTLRRDILRSEILVRDGS